MVRGIYTGASSMVAKQREMDVVANNLANVNTSGFKRDQTLFKSFPEMVLRRINDDGVRKIPIGSYDERPVIGKLGTGVEVNEVYTHFEQGNLKETENAFDLAIEGEGFFAIETPRGERYTRDGSFTVGPEGFLVTRNGMRVLGEEGPISVKRNNWMVKPDGQIFIDGVFQEGERQVQMGENGFINAERIDQLKVVHFERPRYLEKQGESFYRYREEAGSISDNGGERSRVQQGFIESANVNVVREMVKMIEIQRAYEASQKSVSSHDQALERLVNQMASA